MQDKIRIAIAGYGNLGRGAEQAVLKSPDMSLCGILTRRDPSSLKVKAQGVPVYSYEDAARLSRENAFDVVIVCGGSATDLPEIGPKFAALFNTIDSFDTHAKIPAYFESMDKASRAGGHISILSVGWDPGLFSLNRAYAEAVLPSGETYTFWGRGVSQGHSDAIRRIEGVKDARQYTIPVEEAMEKVRSGQTPSLSTREKHTRECFVVLEPDADAARIENEIKTMPNYFDEYDTTVHFISQQELERDHAGLPHGGFVIRSGETGESGSRHIIEYSLKLDSNAEFTASVLVSYARAAFRMNRQGDAGAKTVLDVPPALLSVKSGQELRASLL